MGQHTRSELGKSSDLTGFRSSSATANTALRAPAGSTSSLQSSSRPITNTSSTATVYLYYDGLSKVLLIPTCDARLASLHPFCRANGED